MSAVESPCVRHSSKQRKTYMRKLKKVFTILVGKVTVSSSDPWHRALTCPVLASQGSAARHTGCSRHNPSSEATAADATHTKCSGSAMQCGVVYPAMSIFSICADECDISFSLSEALTGSDPGPRAQCSATPLLHILFGYLCILHLSNAHPCTRVVSLVRERG